jgi:hypothetical protein
MENKENLQRHLKEAMLSLSLFGSRKHLGGKKSQTMTESKLSNYVQFAIQFFIQTSLHCSSMESDNGL